MTLTPSPIPRPNQHQSLYKDWDKAKIRTKIKKETKAETDTTVMIKTRINSKAGL
jgi:hypothetical protein